MAARASMAALILRVRSMTNDTLPLGSGQIFSDDEIQEVMDASRIDVVNALLTPRPTYTTSQFQYLDYYSSPGACNWETDFVLKQYLTIPVTPSATELIAGHFQFATNTYPGIYITGKSHDLFAASADLLERWSVKWALLFSVSVDGQSFQRNQVHRNLLDLANRYRRQARARSVSLTRSDAGYASATGNGGPSLAPTALDYTAKG